MTRSSSPGCSTLGRAVWVCCPHAVGANLQVWGSGTGPLACVFCGVSCTAGLAGVCPGGGPLTVVRGVWCQALSLSPLPVLRAGSGAPLPMFSGRGWCGCWDPAPIPQRALLQARLARCGGGRRVSQGGASCCCEWCLGLGAHPLSAARPWGRQQSGSATHLLWARACGCGGPALALWHACLAGCPAPQG